MSTLICFCMQYATRSGSTWLMDGTGLRRLLRDMEALVGPATHITGPHIQGANTAEMATSGRRSQPVALT